MINFCTLFDINYFSRGMAMYESLKKHCSEFHLYIFPFDDICSDNLEKLKLEFVTLVRLSDFEDKELLSIKPQRTKAEYCWTCTSSTILFCLEKYNLENCTYIDADTYFYSDPKILIDELPENKSVIITEHRFSPEYISNSIFGIYCVQFMTFLNNHDAKKVLYWWRNACLDWCYARYEDGKFGDQKYLDDWTTRFECVHILKNLGGGIAPWNLQQYKFYYKNSKLYIEDLSNGGRNELVFFHFHNLKFFKNKIVCFSEYKLNRFVRNNIYKDYINNLMNVKKDILILNSDIDINGAKEYCKYTPYTLKDKLYVIRKDFFKALKEFNIIKIYKILFNFNNMFANYNYYYFD